ncbi:MAG: sulfotransferase [Planctomycetota bacterium]|jgi:hypothetical protein|nr:sulfotransferase [Planctomycetota bacterium]
MKGILKAIKSLDPGLLKPFEALAAPPFAPKRSSDAPLIILLATPRSGSTYCYQAMCHRFDINYFSNAVYMGARYPFMSTRFARRWCSPYVSDFKSDYGFVAGLNGPAEANDIWGEWFDQHLVEVVPAPEEKRLTRALNYFDWLWGGTGKPFVTGWVGHILYAEQMASLFPNAVFVNLERATQDVATSLIRARRHADQDFGQWFSTRSRDCLGEPSCDPFHDVVKQVVSLQSRATEFVQATGDRVFRLNYEDLCRDPEHEMSRLSRFCRERGIELNPRTDTPEIAGHERSARIDDDYRQVQEAITNLTGDEDEG